LIQVDCLNESPVKKQNSILPAIPATFLLFSIIYYMFSLRCSNG